MKEISIDMLGLIALIFAILILMFAWLWEKINAGITTQSVSSNYLLSVIGILMIMFALLLYKKGKS